MNDSGKVKLNHTRRAAFVYIRQSQRHLIDITRSEVAVCKLFETSMLRKPVSDGCAYRTSRDDPDIPAGKKCEMHLSPKVRSCLCSLVRVAVIANASEIGALSSTSSRAQLQQYSRVIPKAHIEFPLHVRPWRTV